jgi:hypothetical protein
MTNPRTEPETDMLKLVVWNHHHLFLPENVAISHNLCVILTSNINKAEPPGRNTCITCVAFLGRLSREDHSRLSNSERDVNA